MEIKTFKTAIRSFVSGESKAIDALTEATRNAELQSALIEIIEKYAAAGGNSCDEIKRIRAALRKVEVEDGETAWTIKHSKDSGWVLTRAKARENSKPKQTGAAADLAKLVKTHGVEDVAAAILGHGALKEVLVYLAKKR